MTRSEVDAQTLAMLLYAVNRSKRTVSVTVPGHFVAMKSGKPALASLLRSGDARLKVYLTLRMLATRAPHRISVSARDLALLLDLGEEPAGPRRINSALRALADLNLLKVRPRAGKSPNIQVASPPGSSNHPVVLPIELWKHGWIIKMSAAGLTVFLALLKLTYNRPNGAWLTPDVRATYGFSDDTWTRGTQELQELGVASTERRLQRSFLYPIRNRLWYSLDLEKIKFQVPGGREYSKNLLHGLETQLRNLGEQPLPSLGTPDAADDAATPTADAPGPEQ